MMLFLLKVTMLLFIELFREVSDNN